MAGRRVRFVWLGHRGHPLTRGLAAAGFEVLRVLDHVGRGASTGFVRGSLERWGSAPAADAVSAARRRRTGPAGGGDGDAAPDRSLSGGVLASGMRPLGGFSYEDLLANGQAVVGSPAAVADRLAGLYEKLGGFGQLIGLFAIGPSTHQQVMRSAELFASDVMPALRPLGVAAERTTT